MRVFVILGILLAACSARAAEFHPKCVKNEEFQVVYRDRIGGPGSIILVQRLHPGQPPRWCFFKRQPGDFSLTGPGDDMNVIGLVGNVLVLDTGTGPSREIAFFDLESRNWLRTEPYDNEVPVKIDPGTVKFSAVTGPGTAETCPEFKDYSEKGLAAALAQEAIIQFPSGQMVLSGPIRCIPRQ